VNRGTLEHTGTLNQHCSLKEREETITTGEKEELKKRGGERKGSHRRPREKEKEDPERETGARGGRDSVFAKLKEHHAVLKREEGRAGQWEGWGLTTPENQRGLLTAGILGETEAWR